jgi:hypothetical protein|tara:strand:+ start:1375 stop:1521 length:147 start_codon:yes stop_codon:yes gene_type:complete
MSEIQAALIFPFIPIGIYLLVEFLLEPPNNDDDDDGGGGLMQPVYNPI